jgi:NAD(P)-dependent dehydrogenase (short-subunit alcohol dehydrogenase family)
MSKGAVVAMTYSVAKDYLEYKLRCNSISPARVHKPFVDGFLHQSYSGREPEVYDILARSQPIGRMAQPTKLRRWRCFFAPKRLLSTGAVIIRATAVSSTCGDSHD